jgi:hypothetical protein
MLSPERGLQPAAPRPLTHPSIPKPHPLARRRPPAFGLLGSSPAFPRPLSPSSSHSLPRRNGSQPARPPSDSPSIRLPDIPVRLIKQRLVRVQLVFEQRPPPTADTIEDHRNQRRDPEPEVPSAGDLVLSDFRYDLDKLILLPVVKTHIPLSFLTLAAS